MQRLTLCKISTFYFLFVYCPQRTGETLNCGMVRCRTGHHWHRNWPVLKASPGMHPCKWWTYEHFLWTNSCKQFAFLIFHVFLVQVASVHRVRFLLCWCLIVDKRTLLNCKALIKLVKDSERTKSKMLLFCCVLINLCTYFHDIWQISVA